MTELMRADFDEDGVEEVLIKEHFYIKSGSFRSLSVSLLSKKDPVSPLEYQPWGGEIEMAQRRHNIARIFR